MQAGNSAICTAVIIGHNHYEKYTLPLVQSLQKHEPTLPIVIVDNNSEPPYPWTSGCWTTWANNESLARAINTGMCDTDNNWYLILDNDVLCTGPFIDYVESFLARNVYGAQRKEWDTFAYLVGWCTFTSDRCWEKVGAMDEGFVGFGYIEVDYFYRAEQLGFEQVCIKGLPFEHIGHGSHEFIPHIEEWRERNKARFKAKHGL